MHATHAYIARRACGKISAAAWDDPGHEKGTGKSVAAWIARGDLVERLPIDLAQQAIGEREGWICKECRGRTCQTGNLFA